LAKVFVDGQGLFTGFERLNITPYYHYQAHPCISPDGSYILFDVEGGKHMFVSFKNSNGSWSTGIDLTNYGFDINAGGPYLSPDGKYLFFHLDGDIWWVDAQGIKNLNPFSGINNLQNDNGIKIYPNPTTDFISIDIIENITSKIEFFNIYGQSVFFKVIDNKHEQIDISNLKSGIYIIEVSNSKSKYQQKIIIE